MTLQRVLIDGEWREASQPVDTYASVNPTTGEELAERYPISGSDDLELALTAATKAARELERVAPETIARFLDAYAAGIEQRADALAEIAHQETGLPRDTRLRATELPRTANQLRQAAQAVREGSWRQATIDTKANIRAMFGPLGAPVVVFGPNNFPFAFNAISGGDLVAAIAAGNPVIAIANPGHPATTHMLAEAALEAIRASEAPRALVQLLYGLPPELGLRLVAHPLVGATGFTGSKNAGLRLKAAADQAGKPVYLELSSINPVFILPGALAERQDALVGELFASCTMGTGQFCTNPGLTVLPAGSAGESFVGALVERFGSAEPGVLLSRAVLRGVTESVASLQKAGATLLVGGAAPDAPGFRFQNTVLRVSGDDFLRQGSALQQEAFGPVTLCVFARDAAQMAEIAESLEGNLTGSIYSDTHGSDESAYAQLEPVLRRKVGRLLNDKMPTGVAVSSAMNHGGPYPSTGHPGFTAVGIPAAIHRFGALYSYDNVREHRLPPALRNTNPNGNMWRLIDGMWTQGSVEVQS